MDFVAEARREVDILSGDLVPKIVERPVVEMLPGPCVPRTVCAGDLPDVGADPVFRIGVVDDIEWVAR